LASGYGWSKEQIMDVYLDEALEYCWQIDYKEASDRMLQIAIVSNPHVKKPKELSNQLKANLKRLERMKFVNEHSELTAKDKARLKKLYGKKNGTKRRRSNSKVSS
jgi:hypothetical protein